MPILQHTGVETAANLIENVIPCVPVRQYVISFPKRIRHYLQTHKILQAVLRIVVDEIRKRLIVCSPGIANAKIGAVSFIQHFGNFLNFHPHFHLIVADGVFSTEDDALLFYEAFITPDDIADIQDSIQSRVLRYFGKRKFFEKETIEKMLVYENSGFSLDAKVRIHFCQLIPGTEDGFSDEFLQYQGTGGVDPPFIESGCDPPHWED